MSNLSKVKTPDGSLYNITDSAARSSIGYIRKNVLKVTGGTASSNGVTFAPDVDGVITLSGTAADAWADYSITGTYNRKETVIDCSDMNYIVSVDTDDTDSMVRIRDFTGDSRVTLASIEGSGSATFTGHVTHVLLSAKTGAHDGKTVKVMIRPEGIVNGDFEPYKPSLQEQIDELKKMIETSGT